MIQVLRDKHDVEVRQGWGMTETSPLGVVNTIKTGLEDLDDDARLDLAAKAGRGLFGIEMRIVDDEGTALPWDGEAFGALQVRGPWVCRDYFKLDGAAGAHTEDGWFETGDVATIDPNGYMAITDRTKDVIKSGGEWISSSGPSARCSSSSRPKARTSARTSCLLTMRARSPGGGRRTTSFLSMSFPIRRPEK
jgi:fatty-acyl-CoA synthase